MYTIFVYLNTRILTFYKPPEPQKKELSLKLIMNRIIILRKWEEHESLVLTFYLYSLEKTAHKALRCFVFRINCFGIKISKCALLSGSKCQDTLTLHIFICKRGYHNEKLYQHISLVRWEKGKHISTYIEERLKVFNTVNVK